MSDPRRPYRRETEEQRRDALILAALAMMAKGGAQSMTVRAIAEEAGTTPGLIRHYFGTKDDLIRCAFERFMGDMTAQSLATPAIKTTDPGRAIAALICASLRPPVLDGEKVRIWASFLQMAQQHPDMRKTHLATYLAYRDRLQRLIESLPGKSNPDRARRLAIACNAVIDGLWLEGAILPSSFAPGEIERIALDAISAILDTPLTADTQP